MKKLFLWTFVAILFCSWAVFAASSDSGLKTAAKDATVVQRAASLAETSPLADIQKKEAAIEEQSTETFVSALSGEPEKPAYMGPKNVPDQNVILQGGDDCASATVIPGIPYSADGTTNGYTNDYDEVCPYSGSTSPDVVYSYEPAADILINISLCQGQTNYDTKLYVYEDVCQPPDDGNPPYACNDDYCSDPYLFVSELQCVPLFAGHVYYIVVDGYGGDFGDYNIDITECVIPEGPCDNAFYDNGYYDGVNGYACDRRTAPGDLEAWVVDDVEFAEETHIGDIHWYCVTDDTYDFGGTDDIIILDDAGGVPGAPIIELFDVPNVRVATGDVVFSRPVYYYSLYVDFTLPPGLYWMGFRPVNQGTAGQNFWLTAPLTGSDAYFRSAYFGFPDWVPGIQVFGAEANVSFCLTDEPPPTGACCDNDTGDCVDDVSIFDCPVGYRFEAGVLCADLDPPCGEQPPCADFSVVAPGTWNGNTCGAGDDCALRNTEEHIYEVQIPNDGMWAWDLCNSALDTYIFIGTTCCGAEILTQDDSPECGLQSYAEISMTAGTYYIDIEGYSSCGSYELAVYEVAAPTGACCVDEECVATTTELECDDLGGSWYEGETCPEFQCPLPLPCWDGVNILWDNGDTDGTNGYSHWFDLGRYLLDDFVVPDGGMTITDFHQTIIWNTAPPGSGTSYYLAVYEDVGGAPGALIDVLGASIRDEVPTGRNYFGRNEAVVNVCVDAYFLDAGTYWLEMSVDGPENVFAMIHSYLTGSECWWRADDIGYYGPGSGNFGVQADVNFCLTGDVCEPPTGACCDDETGDCIDDVPAPDCPPEFRFEPNTLCADLQPPCGPLPDPCDGAIYQNGDYDGINGYACDRRNIPGDLEAWVVDDVTFAGDNNQIDAIVWYCVTDPTYDFQDTDDFLLLEDDGGVPGAPLYEEFDLPNYRVDTGDIVFSRPVYYYVLDLSGLGINLPAGTYWFGARPVNQSSSGQNFWLTAPLTGSDAYFRSAYFGFPDWVPGLTVFGAEANVDFCLLGPGGGPECDYVAGDANENMAPHELADVVQMIAYYRGTIAPQYFCECGANPSYPPNASQDGNCTPFELGDVVTMICDYRGTCTAQGCPDCPPPGIAPDGGITPTLKSKVKIIEKSSN
jgi:hypothetical protein